MDMRYTIGWIIFTKNNRHDIINDAGTYHRQVQSIYYNPQLFTRTTTFRPNPKKA